MQTDKMNNAKAITKFSVQIETVGALFEQVKKESWLNLDKLSIQLLIAIKGSAPAESVLVVKFNHYTF